MLLEAYTLEMKALPPVQSVELAMLLCVLNGISIRLCKYLCTLVRNVVAV